MKRQAKYLIDNARFTTSSWDYDNRYESSMVEPFPDVIVNHAVGGEISLKRDFQPQKDGMLVLEMCYTAQNSADGLFVRIQDENKKPLFEYRTENGYYVFNGVVTDEPSVTGEIRTAVKINLDEKKAKFTVEGKTVGIYSLFDCGSASTFVLGTTGSCDISVKPKSVRLHADFIANEIFTGAFKYMPDEWKLDGDFEILEDAAGIVPYNYVKTSADAEKSVKAFLPIRRTEGDVSFEGYILLPEGADGFRFSVFDGEKEAFAVCTENCEFKTAKGEFLRKFTPNVWQVIRLETKNKEVTVKIDGKVCGTFSMLSSEFDGISLAFSPDKPANLSFADIVCENIIDYPDYCPKPNQVRHKEYEIGMNMCSMWREGQHFGWDRITHFKENIPLIGPYDEGSPEVADWEIKFMTEHGITFQHYCWYCPDPVIDHPFKRSRMDHALRDGFMNAKYSNMMKFAIMWENATYKNPSVEDFKEYVWKYWCDYFFTDERYLVIDNKPLLSVWCETYKSYWGIEKTREVFEFMNEDIKRYGFDGMWFMSATTVWTLNYKRLSDYNLFDAIYCYHYLEMGCNENFQMSAIDTCTEDCEKRGMATFMKTICSGYNTCAWHGAEERSKLISIDGFEKVLRHAKAHADGCDGKNPLDKFFMISTWNEYGEGTYVMPANIHGFDYLDKIREVFVPESGKCENLLPDENQHKRISYLTVPGRRLIRRHGFEKSNYAVFLPDDVMREWDFTLGKRYDEVDGFNDLKLDYTKNSVIIVPGERQEHYSLIIHNDDGICNADDVSHVRIRMKTDDMAWVRVAFLTEDDKVWNNHKLQYFLQIVTNTDDYTDYVCRIKNSGGWKGKITDIRVDNMILSSVEIEKIELLRYSPEAKNLPGVYINGTRLALDFLPVVDDGHFMVSLDQGKCGFRAFKLYHEYNGITEKLTMETPKDKVVYTVGSDTALKNGEEIKLSRPLTFRDGLPTLALDELCDILNIKYTVDGNKIMVEV